MDDKANLIKPILIFSIIILIFVVVILALQIFQTVRINSLFGEIKTATSTEQYVQTETQQPVVQQNLPAQQSQTGAGAQTPLTAIQQNCLKTCTGAGKTILVCATECNLPPKK